MRQVMKEGMFQKADGRIWSLMNCNGINVEMLWDSGASITVMSENNWYRIGRPDMQRSDIKLSGVFSTSPEMCLGKIYVDILWDGVKGKKGIVIVRNISPGFIGGIDMMRMCGIGLTEVNTIDTSDVELKFNNRDRITAALRSLIDKSNLPLTLLVKEYGSIFMASKFDLGHTTVIKHEIRTTGPPISANPRRQPMHLEDKIDKLVVDLLKANIIKSCKSPWNSPLVIVPKKDESIRMCLDFRRLNNVTEKFTFPVPDIYTLLDTLGGSVIFRPLI